MKMATVAALLVSTVVNAQNDDTAYGNGAPQFDTSGNFNSAFGWETLWANKSGNHNTASGFHALEQITTALENSAMGSQSMWNITGSYNTAQGYYSLWVSNAISKAPPARSMGLDRRYKPPPSKSF
jgi:trimeric autotransporter adhesin